MDKNLKFYLNKLATYQGSVKIYKGEKYMVVPVVMMTEGVRVGAGETGAVLYLEDEMEKTVDSWNGTPIVINHPQNKGGDYITVNTPKGIEKHSIGRVFNVQVINKKLKGECWIAINRIKKISNKAWQYIKDGKQLEVSIGALIQDNSESGKFNGKKYESVARNMIADHLALLPNDEGACNWKEGCGIRANKRSKQINKGGKMKQRTKANKKAKVTPCVQKKVAELVSNKATRFTQEDVPWLEKLSDKELDKMTPKKVKANKKVVEKVVEVPAKEKVKANSKKKKKVVNKQPATVEEYLKDAPKEIQEQIIRGLATNRAERKSLIKSIITNSTDKKSGESVWDKPTLRTQSTEALEKLDKSLKLNTKTKKKKVNNYAAQAASYKPGNKDEGEFLFPGDVKFAKNKKKK